MAQPRDDSHEQDQGEVREPPNSTVDDWLGQRVERDTRRAERLVEETDDLEEAEARWETDAEKHRPGDLPTEQRPAFDRSTGRSPADPDPR